MERIVYRKTLDVHKNGVQFMLQGFETADKMSRRIELSLMASGDTIDFPLEQITAVMYVTTPNATEPSINACVIKDNTIIYDVLPITEEGITEMQVKLIGTKVGGANGVLPTPRFAVEVSKSNVDDGGATQTPTYTALEDALARAKDVYDSRLLRIELDTDCTFRAIYADGTVYESDVLKELFLKGDAELSKSYAKGGTGIRAGEDTDNSMYYSNVSKSASEDAKMVKEESAEILTEVQKHGVYTAFYIDFERGEVEYISPSYKFNINKETGELEAIGEAYECADIIEQYVDEWYEKQGAITDDIARHESLINGMNGTLSNHGDDLNEYSKTLAEHSKKLQEHSDFFNEHSSAINDHNIAISGNIGDIETLKTQYSVLEGKYANCENKEEILFEGKFTDSFEYGSIVIPNLHKYDLVQVFGEYGECCLCTVYVTNGDDTTLKTSVRGQGTSFGVYDNVGQGTISFSSVCLDFDFNLLTNTLLSNGSAQIEFDGSNVDGQSFHVFEFPIVKIVGIKQKAISEEE